MTIRVARALLLALVPLCVALALALVLQPWGDDRDEGAPTIVPVGSLEPRLGGLTTTFHADRGAFGLVARGLVADELIRFSDGRVVFDRFYRPETGLDADALAANCAHCHPAHGRSIDPIGRVAPQLIGLGLLEAIPGDVLVGRADPDDADGDGISGRLGEGRFGWTASQPTVDSQVVHALDADFGVTIDEIDSAELGDLIFYTELLAVPAQRDVDDEVVRRGAAAFEAVGCASCHTPSSVTGGSEVAALRQQTIWPYTDLLLHDLGDGEYRTPPLWGVGLLETVHDEVVLLHDGRARSYEAAIAAHGGEAGAVRRAFDELDVADRAAVLVFLASL